MPGVFSLWQEAQVALSLLRCWSAPEGFLSRASSACDALADSASAAPTASDRPAPRNDTSTPATAMRRAREIGRSRRPPPRGTATSLQDGHLVRKAIPP